MKTLLLTIVLLALVAGTAGASTGCLDRVGKSCNYRVTCPTVEYVGISEDGLSLFSVGRSDFEYVIEYVLYLANAVVDGWSIYPVEDGIVKLGEHPSFCNIVTAVEDLSWGAMKSLYR